MKPLPTKYSRLLRGLALISLILPGQLGATVDVTAATATAPTPQASVKQFGNWAVSCRTPRPEQSDGSTDEARGPSCDMSQVLNQQSSGKHVLTLSVQKRDSGLVLVVIAPFGLDVTQQVKVTQDKTALLSAGFRTCLPTVGCIARVGLTTAMQDGLARAETLTVALPKLDGMSPLTMTIPNKGFEAALADLKAGSSI